jgi:integrase
MQLEDPRHELPPEGVFRGNYQRPTPYIFTDDELQRLLAHTQRLRPAGSLRPHTYSTLFTLLAVTGLRPSEALALRLPDITPEGLVIRDTKFGQSRFVPVHATTLEALDRYRQCRCRIAGHIDHLFVSLKRRPLSLGSATRTFRQVLEAAGLPDRPGRPRLYDLRHRFATRALETGPASRELISQHMLALATYLGHSHITYTYWYLEQTPKLMADIAMSCEAFVFGGQS